MKKQKSLSFPSIHVIELLKLKKKKKKKKIAE